MGFSRHSAASGWLFASVLAFSEKRRVHPTEEEPEPKQSRFFFYYLLVVAA
jgi:hypothetical protein